MENSFVLSLFKKGSGKTQIELLLFDVNRIRRPCNGNVFSYFISANSTFNAFQNSLSPFYPITFICERRETLDLIWRMWKKWRIDFQNSPIIFNSFMRNSYSPIKFQNLKGHKKGNKVVNICLFSFQSSDFTSIQRWRKEAE